MSRRRKCRRGSPWYGRWGHSLWRHRVLLCTVSFLAGCGVLFWKSIQWVESYSQRIATLEREVEKTDPGADFGRYLALRRNLEIERVEPMLYGILVLMLLTLATVLIASILNTRSSIDNGSSRSKRGDDKMQERRLAREAKQRSTSTHD